MRSDVRVMMHSCVACDFAFHDHDPNEGLADDQLDQTRLKAAGLEIPSADEDFANGIRQSEAYIDSLTVKPQAGHDVLEVGCSWGYFLKCAADRGARPCGVEINAIRQAYVEKTLGYRCYQTISECLESGSQFDEVYLLYVLEYATDPVGFLEMALALLRPSGRLVLVTPNQHDPLRILWRNQAYEDFFHDLHAVNYFSPRAVQVALEAAGGDTVAVSTVQGYSVVNHLSWYLTGRPRTTGIVGGDRFIDDVCQQLSGTSGDLDDRYQGLRQAAAGLFQQFHERYASLMTDAGIGNQIRAECVPVVHA